MDDEQHPTTLHDDAVIWRYMDLPKLLSLLQSRSLYLSRLDRLRDPWEGQWPQKIVETLFGVPPSVAVSTARMMSVPSKSFFVSCWHESSYESAALWDQYGASRGLAVKSTIGRLKNSIRKDTIRPERTVSIGRVHYIDYLNTELEIPPGVTQHHSPTSRSWAIPGGAILPAFFKRRSFEHEREIRVLLQELPQDDAGLVAHTEAGVNWSVAKLGLDLPMDVHTLIETVYISPESPPWLGNPMRELLRKFDLPGVEVRRSELYDKTIL